MSLEMCVGNENPQLNVFHHTVKDISEIPVKSNQSSECMGQLVCL